MFNLSYAMLSAAITAASPVTYVVDVPHASGSVQAIYSGRVVIEHRQVGSVSPGGRQSTLACRWTANLDVDRTAVTASRSVASRSFTERGIAGGQRPGWCGSVAAAAGQDVAGVLADTQKYLKISAGKDKLPLTAQLDQISAIR